jgi:nucleotide-binding universal stress UspA family protein
VQVAHSISFPPRTAAPVGPVVLATLGTRLDPEAERVAIDCALENGTRLLLVNATTARCAPRTPTVPREEDYEAVRGSADRAAARGIFTEFLRVRTPHPARAIVQIANERGAALLVLGPERRRWWRMWRVRRAARAIKRGTACLVWLPS